MHIVYQISRLFLMFATYNKTMQENFFKKKERQLLRKPRFLKLLICSTYCYALLKCRYN